jgi:hypothetical protein
MLKLSKIWSDEKKPNTSKLISGIYIFFCFLKIQGLDIRHPTNKKCGLTA